MKKRFVSFILILIITIISFSSCRLKAPAELARNYDGIELTYYKMYDDSEVMEPMINQYIASHPGLKINYKQFTDFEQYINLILNEMAEGEGPDVFSMQNTWFKSNYKKLSPMPAEFGGIEGFSATFVDVAYKDLVRPNQKGIETVYGIPLTVDTLAIYYNKDQFEDRIPSQGKPSTTWDGILKDISLLSKEDSSFSRFEVAGIALGRSDNIERAVDILYLLFLQNKIDFYNENYSEAIFASKLKGSSYMSTSEIMDFYTSFANPNHKNYTWNNYLADEEGKELEAFARGKVSMIIAYSFTYEQIINEINILKSKGVKTIDKESIKVAPIPQSFDPKNSTEKRVAYASYFAETVSRNSEHADIAWDFLVFMASSDNLTYYFDKLKHPSSRRDMINEQKNYPIYGVFASQVGFAESFPIIDYKVYKTLFKNLISKINDGENGKQLLLNVQDKISSLLPTEGLIQEYYKIDKSEENSEKNDE